MPVCSQCGRESPKGFRFCGSCGASLEAPAREVRKTVTLLFCDVSGSTGLGERLDPETLRRVMRRYFDEIAAMIERHGGTVEKFVGDAVMAVFGVPQVHEDDALRAVRAAAEIRDRLPLVAAELGVELAFRTGLNTGEVVVGAGQTLATGDAVNVAARLEQAAAPGEILIGGETRRLVRAAVVVEPVEPLALKGKSDAVEAYRLIGVDPAAPALARRLDAALVGRGRELRLLSEALDRAVEERRCHLFTLLGPAGVGKSRLVAELLSSVGTQAVVVRGRCLHYGEGITFFPLVEALMQLGERAGAVLTLVTEGGALAPNELFFAVRRLLEEVAQERPLLVVLDDLQWAEPMLLDLLDHVADLSRGAPILLLCVARPELLEERPGWGGGKLNATTVLLEPLGREESEQLLDSLGNGLDAAARQRIVEASEGNPLFLEEMAALTAEAGDVRVPPTIQALLAARLERLGEGERTVMEHGAVEGKVFHRGAVSELSPEALRSQVDSQLVSLVRKELIRPDEAMLPGEDAFRFRHLLIRDAAYEALPKQARAELHARFAEWLERHSGELVELEEIAGWHLEQAVRYRRELGLADERELIARAADRLAAAGHHALARVDLRAAANLFGRAYDLLPPGDSRRPELALALAELLGGEPERTDALLAEAEAEPATHAAATVLRFEWLMHARPEEAIRFAEQELAAAIERLHETGDEAWLARAHLARSQMFWLRSLAEPTAAELRQAIEHAEQAGDRRLRGRAASILTGPLKWGPTDAKAMRRQLASLEAEELGAFGSSSVAMVRSLLAQLDGDFDEARRELRRANELFGELGLETLRASTGQEAGQVELAAGDVKEAIRVLRASYDELGRLGEHAWRSTSGAMLARALYLDGQDDEAERTARAAEGESAREDVINFAIARGVLARIHADRGLLEEAEELARTAVKYAYETDFPVMRADAQADLAFVLRAGGRLDEAGAALEEAIRLYEQKGDRVHATRTRAELDDLCRPTASAS